MTNMKTLVLVAAITAGMSATAMAADFDNTAVDVTVSSGQLEFTLGTVAGEVATIETGAYLTDGELAGASIYTYGSVGYDRLSNEMLAGVEVGAIKTLDPLWTVYASASLDYAAPSADLADGDWSVAPTVGVSRNLGDTASVFAETGYSWNASEDFAAQGGYVEVGASFGVAENVMLTPSLVRTFDTGADETNANLAVSLAF